MNLSNQEADLFFRLMWGLQFYVKQESRILPKVKSIEDYARTPASEMLKVRDALWAKPGLIDAYVKENPDGLSAEERDIVGKWKGFVAGTFHIFRLLKKHAVFIGEDSRVYGVLGLRDSLEDLFYGRPLPIMVKAVLLPFKGKVVYDGMLQGYNITFGGGIRSRLNEQYMTAKQNGRILTILEPEPEGPLRQEPRTPDRDWRAAVDDVVDATEKMKGGSPLHSAAFALLRASARLSQAAVHHPADLEELWHQERQVRKAWTRLRTTLQRAQG